MQPVQLGNHELLVRLASGGAANVFLVRDLTSPKQDLLLALKILLPSLASNDDFLNMFFTEARIAARLDHENVVGITGFGQVEGIHCLAMEYVFGASLAQVLRASARAKKPLTVGVLLRITAAVCDALHFAHEMTNDDGESMGLVHRDVTPQNILIGFNGVPKLTDFGIAKATGRGWETQAGIVKGKFSYMSPEQALGKKVDRRSDIFGTGIVLWEALTGRDLFRGSTPMEVLAAIREQRIEPPSKVVPGLTPIVDPIVMKALRRSPRQRYQTAAEMRDDILDLIRRAGVEINSATIAKEFYSIYGEEIGVRAVELRKAMAGKADIESLAKVLGGHPLNKKHLPVIPGGVTDPDPLGLFTESTPEPPPEPAEYDIVEVVADVQPRPWSNETSEAKSIPPEDGVTNWNAAAGAEPHQDELLSMLSEEDATIGVVPKAFAHHFGAQFAEARKQEQAQLAAFGDDEATVGVGGGTAGAIVPIRSLSTLDDDDASGGGWDAPPTAYGDVRPPEMGLRSPVTGARGLAPITPDPRPVPRAPSLALDDDEGAENTEAFTRSPDLFGDQDETPGPNGVLPIPDGTMSHEDSGEPPPLPSAAPQTNNPLPMLEPEEEDAPRAHPTADLAVPESDVSQAAKGRGLSIPWPAFVILVLALLVLGFGAGFLFR
ncbi:MAG: protein kinase [Myxococcota bacterium]